MLCPPVGVSFKDLGVCQLLGGSSPSFALERVHQGPGWLVRLGRLALPWRVRRSMVAAAGGSALMYGPRWRHCRMRRCGCCAAKSCMRCCARACGPLRRHQSMLCLTSRGVAMLWRWLCWPHGICSPGRLHWGRAKRPSCSAWAAPLGVAARCMRGGGAALWRSHRWQRVAGVRGGGGLVGGLAYSPHVLRRSFLLRETVEVQWRACMDRRRDFVGSPIPDAVASCWSVAAVVGAVPQAVVWRLCAEDWEHRFWRCPATMPVRGPGGCDRPGMAARRVAGGRRARACGDARGA